MEELYVANCAWNVGDSLTAFEKPGGNSWKFLESVSAARNADG